ncbi:MAG TPA: DUF58 domain-containing protein [Candidatus Deferrimicrobiaceae bacterium]
MPRRLRPPRRLRITREGKAFLLLTLGVGIAAVNTGNNLLYLALSANLALVTLSGFLSEWTLRRISLALAPASDPFAGSEALLVASCSATGKRFPGLSLAASARVQGSDLSFRFPDVPPGGSVSRVVRFLPASRGRVGAIPAALSTRFPFALFEKSVDMDLPAGWAVYPCPAPSGEWRRILLDSSTEEDPRNAGRAGAFPRGAREHLPADPVRDIHWKATARAGRWMVKEREGESTPAVDLRVPAPCPGGDFERRISEACGAVLALEERGIPYRLWLGDRLVSDAADRDRRGRALEALGTARADGTLDGEPGT